MRKEMKRAMVDSMKKYLLASFTSFLLLRLTSRDWKRTETLKKKKSKMQQAKLLTLKLLGCMTDFYILLSLHAKQARF